MTVFVGLLVFLSDSRKCCAFASRTKLAWTDNASFAPFAQSHHLLVIGWLGVMLGSTTATLERYTPRLWHFSFAQSKTDGRDGI